MSRWNVVEEFTTCIDGELVNCPFQFQERRQLFIRTHNEAFPVVAMYIDNPDSSPVGINR